MNTRHFVRRSLLHHWRINLAVGLGVAAATAVLTGALLIGDSMRGSLRDLTLGRLGTIDELLVTQHFFREQLVDELQTNPDFKQHYHRATGAILFPQGTLQFHSDVPAQTPDSHQNNVHVAGNVLLLGVRELYWQFDLTEHSGSVHPGQNEIVLNQTLADELQVQVGDQVTLRLPENKQVSADSPLGNKDDRIHSIPRLTVSAIIPAKGLGRFSLNPSQQTSLNAYLDLEMLQQELRQRGNVNAILVSSRQQDQPPDAIGSEALQKALKPTIEDYGLLLNEVDLQYQRKEQDGPSSQVTVSRYYSLSSERMMLADEFVELANTATQNQAQPVLTYLANALMKVPNGESPKPEGGMVTGKRDETTYGTIVPYSVVTAVDSNAALGPLTNRKGEPILVGDQEVVISDWLANDLQMERGDWLRIDYFQPETTHGNTEEYFIDLQVVDILPLTSPSRPFSRRKKAVFESPPTLITDPDLTPAVPGVTDQD
ncbi:MAG: ABC transporter permease, partial [Planctomycetota bacterium]|nr:ABC transporter permease [Planctomycetota bacterium]